MRWVLVLALALAAVCRSPERAAHRELGDFPECGGAGGVLKQECP